jgi:hypothetical protein
MKLSGQCDLYCLYLKVCLFSLSVYSTRFGSVSASPRAF